MMKNGKLPRQPQQYTTIPDRAVGDFSFVMIHEDLSPETQINGWEKAIIQARLFLQKIALTPIKWFGLEYADTMIEHVPLVLGKTYFHKLRELHHLDKIPPSDTGEEE
jgi:KUP system potassium uptake protein